MKVRTRLSRQRQSYWRISSVEQRNQGAFVPNLTLTIEHAPPTLFAVAAFDASFYNFRKFCR